MVDVTYLLNIRCEDQALAGASTVALTDTLQELEGVLAERSKAAGASTMDLGATISVIATSGATLAIAQGVSAWLRARRGVTLTVEKDSETESLKAAVSGIDPNAAERIVELIRGG
jgi:hypothetical protein